MVSRLPARAPANASARRMSFWRDRRIVPLVHLFERPIRVAILMAVVAGVRNAVADGIFRNRDAHGMIADLGFDAQNRAGHVAFHAGTAGARRRVMGVGLECVADAGVAARAEGVGVRAKLRILIDIHFVRRRVAADAGDAAFEKTFALPQTEGVV